MLIFESLYLLHHDAHRLRHGHLFPVAGHVIAFLLCHRPEHFKSFLVPLRAFSTALPSTARPAKLFIISIPLTDASTFRIGLNHNEGSAYGEGEVTKKGLAHTFLIPFRMASMALPLSMR